MQQKLCYETSQGVGGTCCLHLQGGRALKTGIRIYQHTMLLSGSRTVKLVTPSCCSLDNQQHYNNFGGYTRISRNVLTTEQENALWQNCYERALDEEQKEEEDFRKVGYLHSQPPENPKSHYRTHARLSETNTYTHTHTHTHTHRD